ncbi:hypothetical protein [uncultured Sphaerochaeta sp.]|uniref:hypothetical protein n=1 Tax=uncultured Sphaerochaeta sp. TaxID=886478 RepID=UPI002A0A49C0|nr:hypothetical protein [uncultured Sphaerochaeta sp.]
MNKIWSVVLIVIAVLTVAAGTYWYVEFRPLAGQRGTEQTATSEQTGKSETIQVPEVSPAQYVEPKQATELPPELMQRPEEPVQEPPTPSMPVMREEAKQSVIQVTEPMPLPIDPLIKNGILKLPRPRGPVVQVPFAPPRVAGTDQEEKGLMEKAAPVLGLEEEPRKKEEQMVLPLPEEETQKVILKPSTPSVATSAVTFDEEAFQWSINSSVSFLDYQFPGSDKGFDIQVDLLRHTEGAFRFGGTLEYAKVGGDQEISVLGKVQWNLRDDKPLSFPLSVSLGPTVIIPSSGSNEFGVTGKIQGGVSYALTEWMRVFYEAGVQAQWVITANDFTIQLEPMRIGFGFSF